MQNPLDVVSRIIRHLPEGDHQIPSHDLRIIMTDLAGLNPDQLRALLVLAEGHAALVAAVQTELSSRVKRGPNDP